MDDDVLMVSTVDGELSAISLSTGLEKWRLGTGGPLVELSRCSPSSDEISTPEPYVPDLGGSQCLYVPSHGELVPATTLPDVLRHPLLRVAPHLTMVTSNTLRMLQVDAISGAVQIPPESADPNHGEFLTTPASIRVVRANADISLFGKTRLKWRLLVGSISLVLPSISPNMSPTTSSAATADLDSRIDSVIQSLRVEVGGLITAKDWTTDLAEGIVAATIFFKDGKTLRSVVIEESLASTPKMDVITKRSSAPNHPPAVRVHSFGDSAYVVCPTTAAAAVFGDRVHVSRTQSHRGVHRSLSSPSRAPHTPLLLKDKLEETPEDTLLPLTHGIYAAQFEHLGILGKGGQGVVLKARHRLTGTLYAIKVVKLKATSRLLVLHEARTHALLEHPHVVRYCTSWEETGYPTLPPKGLAVTDTLSERGYFSSYEETEESTASTTTNIGSSITSLCIQMAYYPCGTLADYLANTRTCVNEAENDEILRQLRDALEYIHSQGVVHRDVKPSNVMLEGDHLSSCPKIKCRLGDFGLSVDGDGAGEEDAQLHHGGQAGTPLYSPPEGNVIHVRSDIFSLGVLYFETFLVCTTQSERIRRLTDLTQCGMIGSDLMEQYPVAMGKVLKMTMKDPEGRTFC